MKFLKVKRLTQIKFDHLFRLTDSLGIFQHSFFTLPDFSKGYTTDDNARALVIALALLKLTSNPIFLKLSETYLSFLKYTQRDDGYWHNYVGFNRDYLDEKGSEDSFGRAFMCACYVSANAEKRLNTGAKDLVYKAHPNILSLKSPRAIAFAILGLKQLIGNIAIGNVIDAIKIMSDKLCDYYYKTRKTGWYWFEDIIAYSNGVLPASLIYAYSVLGEDKYLKIGLESLDFLTQNLFEKGYLKIIGNEGWWKYGEKRAEFDEQPVDAGSMVLVYSVTRKVTGEKRFDKFLKLSWSWFFGKNSLNVSLYDEETGGCFDGITERGVNENEGAESLLSLIGSYVIMNNLKDLYE